MQKLFYNAKIYSMNFENDIYSAMLTKNGKIVEMFKQAPQINDAVKIDLQNTCVIPGLIDTHTHSFEGGLYSLGAFLGNCKNLAEVFELLAACKPVGNMIFSFGLDENLLTEKRFPTLTELDKINNELPILLRRIDGHSCVVNTKGLELSKISKKANFDGLLKGTDNDVCVHSFHKAVAPEGILKSYKKAESIAFENGITAMHTMIGDANTDPRHFSLMLDNLNKFDLDWVIYPQILDVDLAVKLGSKRVGGCILADGSIGSYTAGLLEPYTTKPETKGNLYQTDEFWGDFFEKAHSNGLQACVHSIGDAASNQIINAIEKAQNKKPKNIKHELIHGELLAEGSLKRLKNNNIAWVSQPMFDRLWGGQKGFYAKVLGQTRASKMNCLKQAVDAGVLVTGSSDWYVTELNALKGIHAASNMHNSNHILSTYNAINLYTKNAAILSNDENKFGTLKNGLNADFICLENNIFEQIDFKPKSVYKLGQKVYGN